MNKYILFFCLIAVTNVLLAQTYTISPTQIDQGENLTVNFSGTATNFSAGTSTFWFSKGGSTIHGFENISTNTSASLYINVPADKDTGYYDVNYQNSVDGLVTINNGFYVNLVRRMTFALHSEPFGQQGDTVHVTVLGYKTRFNQGVGSFQLTQGGTTINSLSETVITDERIDLSFALPAGTTIGFYNVEYNSSLDGVLLIEDQFLVGSTAPKQIAISPNSGEQGEILTVNFSGTNTTFSQGTPTGSYTFSKGGTSFNGYGSPVSFVSNNISLNIPLNADTGVYDVTYHSDLDGTVQLMNAFTVLPAPDPTISITPDNGSQGETLTINFSGTHSHFQQGTQTANFWLSNGNYRIDPNNESVFNYTYANITFDLPANADTGYYSVYAKNMLDGTIELSDGFYLDALLGFTPPPPLLNVNVTTTSVTGPSDCVGTASLAISGGIAPYSIEFFDGSTMSTIGSLCPGVYYVDVSDADNRHVRTHFVIATSSNVFVNVNDYADSTLSGVLSASSEEICDLDYDNISSVEIINVVLQDSLFTGGSSALTVDWKVSFTNGSDTTIIQEYLVDSAGTYEIHFSIYCAEKAPVDQHFQAIDYINLTSTMVGISSADLTNPISLDIYPNPSTGQINLQLLSTQKAKDVQIQIINQFGQITKEFMLDQVKQEIMLDEGVYFIRTRLNEWSETKKVVVIH